MATTGEIIFDGAEGVVNSNLLPPSQSESASASNSRRDLDSNPCEHLYFQPAPALARSRYNRQILIPSISISGQTKISRCKVLIVGLGGLGSPASLYLAGAGVHTLGLLDHDFVEESNLHRQIVHRESSVDGGGVGGGAGRPMSKVQSAMRSCRELNSDVNYVAHEVRVNGTNALEIIGAYDVVLDCTDNPATRYLVSDCCVVLGKTLVSGAGQKLEGQLMVLNWSVYGDEGGASERKKKVVVDRGPCYRCIFPRPPDPGMVRSCSEIGILGPVVGTIGTLMASETIRLIVREGNEGRKATMLLYNAWPSDPKSMFRTIGLRSRRKDCVTCGEDEVLQQKGIQKITADRIRKHGMDYESWCGVADEVDLLNEDERTTVHEFFKRLHQHGPTENDRPVVVDVREEYEVELGPKIDGSINIPFSTILRNVDAAASTNGFKHQQQQQDAFHLLPPDSVRRSIYFLCQRGNDSQIAARKLLDRRMDVSSERETDPVPAGWIGDVKGGFVAIERYMQFNS